MGALSGLISIFSLIAVSSLDIGDKAPQFIAEAQWIKGSAPVIEKSITVVELWKTTCSSCRGQIQHLTNLQKSYGGRISIVAINTEPIDVLKQFMEEHGNEIGYTVGHVSKDVISRFTETSVSLPYCYVIDRKGQILWKGHPADIEDSLEKALNNNADIEKAKNIGALEKSFDEALKSEDSSKIASAINALLAADPSNVKALEVGIEIAKYNNDSELIRKMFDMVPMSDLSGDKAQKFASMLISESIFDYRYPEVAVKFIEYALKKNPEKSSYIETYARLLYCLGDLENALVWQEKAVKLDPKNKTCKDNLNYYIAIKKLQSSRQKN